MSHLLLLRRLTATVTWRCPSTQQALHSYHTTCAHYAGHSHWNNIKHKKALQDKKRARINDKIAKEIQNAVRVNGDNVESNIQLRLALERARLFNLPKTAIQNAIKSGLGITGAAIDQIMYEGVHGPSGVQVLVSTLTDKRTRTVQFVRKNFTDNAGTMGGVGNVSWNFEQKGILVFEDMEAEEAQEQLFEVSLEHGAEDFEYDEENKAVTLICAPDAVHKLRDHIHSVMNLEAVHMDIIMKPKDLTDVDPDSETGLQLAKLFDDLDDNDDVQKVFSNVNWVKE